MRFALLIILLSAFAANPLAAAADSLSQVEAQLGLRASEVVAEANNSPASGTRFSSTGAEFHTNQFAEHPWKDGNASWKEVWQQRDDSIVKKGFNQYRESCFDMQPLGCCCLNGCDDCPWTMVGYWWPEVVITINNYCISALMGPQGSVVTYSNGETAVNPPGYQQAGLGADGAPMNFHGGCFNDQQSWRSALDSLLGPTVAAKIVAGLPGVTVSGNGTTNIPAQLRDAPHLGNSAVTSIGLGGALGLETTNLEAHLYRTWTDVQASRGEFNPASALSSCFTPKCTGPWLGNKIWPRLQTENPTRDMLARWRLPERSAERVNGGGFCNSLYQDRWQGVPETASFSLTDVPDNFNKLVSNTCAGYRASAAGAANLGWESPIREMLPEIAAVSTPALEQNCLQSEVGQVYPLVGEYQSDNEAAGNISLALRANEWASWCKWPESVRSNIFNYKGALYSDFHPSSAGKNTVTTNINRSSGAYFGPRDFSYISWPTPPDKLQRVFPVKDRSDSCFFADDADKRRRPDLFPPGLYAGNTTGETRFVIWNYRTCCVCPECDGDEAMACVPMTE